MPSHYLKQCWYFVNWILRSKLHWNFNQNTNLFIHENAFKISSAERRPFCPGGTELTGTDYKTATKQSIANLVDIMRVTLCLVLLMEYMALEIESCHNATGCHNLRCHQWNPLFTNGVASYDKVGMMTAVTLTSGPAKGDKVGTMAIFSFTHRAAKVGISVGFQCTFATIFSPVPCATATSTPVTTPQTTPTTPQQTTQPTTPPLTTAPATTPGATTPVTTPAATTPVTTPAGTTRFTCASGVATGG